MFNYREIIPTPFNSRRAHIQKVWILLTGVCTSCIRVCEPEPLGRYPPVRLLRGNPLITGILFCVCFIGKGLCYEAK